MLHPDPSTPYVSRTLSDLGGENNDTGVFSSIHDDLSTPAPQSGAD